MSGELNLKWELFVFDWDGTLMSTTDLIVRGYQHAAEELGLLVPPTARVKSTIGMNLHDSIYTSCPDCPEEDYDRFFKSYTSWYLDQERQLGMVPGMRELLEQMHGLGLRLALATGKSNKGVKRVFDRFDLWDLFEEIQTADKNFSKPNPGMLLNLEDLTGVECSSMVMIGDSTMDLLMASNAGASSIGVTFGASSAEDLRKVNPVAVCSSTAQLAAALGLEGIVKLPPEASVEL